MKNDSVLLSLIIFAPWAGAALLALLRGARPVVSRTVALVFSLSTLGLGFVALRSFDPAQTSPQFVENHVWITGLNVHYHLGLDGLSLVLVLLTGLVTPAALLASWRVPQSPRMFSALFLLLQGAALGVFLALDFFHWFVFWELSLIPAFFLIKLWGGPAASRAAYQFVIYTIGGSAFMLLGFAALYVATGTLDFTQLAQLAADGVIGAKLAALGGIWPKAVFVGVFLGLAVKVPLWPFHTWLPDAAVHATPASAVLMMAIVDKVGTFAMLRYCIQLFPEASRYFTPVIITLAVIGIVYGAIVAIGQTDVMRLIAYTSISHFGFIILGIFAMTSQGQSGSTLYMVNHGISTAALMLVAGFLVSRKGSRLIAAYGGVQKVAPVLAGSFLVAGLATLSLPGLAPFISEFLVLVGTFTRYPAAAACAVIALVLAAIYVLWMYQRMMTGPLAPGNESIGDLKRRELTVVAPLIAMLLVLGIYPKPLLDIVNPAVEQTLRTVNEKDPPPAVADVALRHGEGERR